MASGGRRRRRSREEDGPGFGMGLLAVGAAAAGVAALAYGAKKLYDYVTEEARAEAAKLGSDGPPRASTSQPQASTTSRPQPQNKALLPKDTKPKDTCNGTVSLAQQLDEYYTRSVRVCPASAREANLWVDGVRQLVEDCLAEQNAKVVTTGLTPFGSAAEDLMVVAPSKFDFLVTLPLEHDQWILDDEAGSKCLLIRCKSTNENLDAKSSLAVNSLLSPEAVAGTLMKSLQTLAQNHNLQISIDGAVVVLSHQLPSGTVAMCLYPAACLQGSLLFAKDIVNWQECFYSREAQLLRSLDPEQCCHLRCLQIIKVLRLKHAAQFGFLPSYAYKTILLHMLADTPDPDFWQPECLQEQFIDYLNQLMFYLQSRKLPLFFNRNINLLDGVPAAHCDNLVAFITKRIGKENLHTLLTIDDSINDQVRV